ncbi:DUF475 domain-containing protein [Streptomyces mirabilis]
MLLAGQAPIFMFLYLEIPDFDGVTGILPITNDIVCMAQLGHRRNVRPLAHCLPGPPGTLDDYACPGRGAHCSIGALAVIRMVTIQHEINEVLATLVGVA